MSITSSTLRFIGGTSHGQSHPVPSVADRVARIGVTTDEPTRTANRNLMVRSHQVEEVYERKTITLRFPNGTLTEEVMVLKGTNLGTAQRQLAMLGLPKIDFPAMTPLALRSSSLVKNAAYCKRTRTLDLTLTTGTYRYEGVSPSVVFDMLTADSLGSFFNSHILRAYRCEKIA